MRDYRYVDKDRLQSYLEQFEAVPKSANRERKSSIKFSLGFVTAGVEEKRPSGELSEHEKVQALIGYLRRENQLIESRPSEDTPNVDFVFEQCEAFDVNVPTRSADSPRPALRFWLSPGNESHGALCLMESFLHPDETYLSFRRMSTFSVLASFVYHARREIDESVLIRVIPRINHPNLDSKIDETHPASHHYEYYSVDDYIWEFIAKPEKLLKDWGCEIGRRKKISVLYRILEIGREAANNWQKVSIFGYPVALWTGGA